MGVLDELKQQARAIDAEKAREKALHAEALARVRERIEPCMRSAYKYFNELEHHLQLVNRDIEASYEIRGAGRVDGLKQGQYRVSTGNSEQLDKFAFRCICAKSGVLQVNQSDAASVAAYRDYLRAHGLQAKIRGSTNSKGAVFMVQPAVPVVVEFNAEFERGAVLVCVRNLTNIGVSRHALTAEQIDEKFLDEVAKAVLRRPNRFDEITGNAVSNTYRQRLKTKIQSTARQNELADELVRRDAARDRTITKRLSRTLLGRVGRFR